MNAFPILSAIQIGDAVGLIYPIIAFLALLIGESCPGTTHAIMLQTHARIVTSAGRRLAVMGDFALLAACPLWECGGRRALSGASMARDRRRQAFDRLMASVPAEMRERSGGGDSTRQVGDLGRRSAAANVARSAVASAGVWRHAAAAVSSDDGRIDGRGVGGRLPARLQWRRAAGKTSALRGTRSDRRHRP